MNAGAVGDVIVDGFWKRVGLLKHHAHLAAQVHHVHIGIININTVEQNTARDPAIGNHVVHPVEAAQKR